MRLIHKFLPIVLVLVLSYFTIKPFFVTGFFPMHDDTQVARVFELNKSLNDGLFPVRWVSDLGYNYGYPIFNFYAPFAYYVGSLFMHLGFDALNATKLMMALGVLLSGVFMYLLAKEFWGRGGGLISALLYLYAPYHAVDIFVRGDVAEFWAYAFIPLTFYGIWMAHKQKQWQYVVIGSLGYAGIILSHNLTAMMITPFVLLFAFLLYIFARQEQKIYKPYFPLLILVLGIVLSASYWLPVFFEMKYTNVLSQVGGGADYRDHFVCLSQLWNSPWGFGGSTPTCVDGLSFKIGKLHILFFVAAFISLFFFRKEKRKFNFAVLSVLAVIFSLFLLLPQAQFIWNAIPPMAFLQYPWRFLLTAVFFLSFLGGAVIYVIRKFVTKTYLFYVVIGFAAALIVYFNLDIFVPQMYLPKTAKDYTSSSALSWTASIISDEYMPKYFVKPQYQIDLPHERFVSAGSLQITDLTESAKQIHAQVKASKKTDMLVKLAYFPTWHVYIDGKQVWFKYFGKGLLVTVPVGTHRVDIIFSQTPIEKIANAISLAGVLLLFIGIIMQRKESSHAKKTT